ncbi:hypothetical protein RB195_020182 [Necator americanus]|uniref:Complex 1 LYR protein domain-containing protein n=1 Tax=Necator americanus TaxID=51031 RepID=A0ABR1CJ12_NECAM
MTCKPKTLRGKGGRMTAPIGRSVWINLYKQLEREAAKFPQYNYRVFAQRRIRDHFEANRGVTDPAVQRELLKKAQDQLEVIRRQRNCQPLTSDFVVAY